MKISDLRGVRGRMGENTRVPANFVPVVSALRYESSMGMIENEVKSKRALAT
jgi:hypothetical protein